MNLITLLTDFGLTNAYVAQMKGTIYSIAPQARCIDITHMVPSHQIEIGGYLLAQAVDYFPKGTVHIGVVDPGVGTNRRGIVVVTNQFVLVGPDNGLLIDAAKKHGHFKVYEITNQSCIKHTVSHTFHGRDIFAPIAANIVKGITFDQIGETITDYKEIQRSKPIITDRIVETEVLFIDDFGNIITNLDAITFHSLIKLATTCNVQINNEVQQLPYVPSYGYTEEQQVLITIGSTGFVEIAVNQGNASQQLDVSVGDSIVFDFS